MALQPIIFIILGIIVSIVSDRVDQDGSMTLFFYLGIIFIIIGIAKLAIKFIMSPKKDYERKRTKKIILCPSCGEKHFETSNYCHKCGTKLEKWNYTKQSEEGEV